MTRKEITQTIARIRRGDSAGFRAIVDTYKDRLYAFLWRIVRDHHEAEDLCQAAFVRAYESLDSYSDRFAFSTWLFTIGYRLTLNRLRKRRPLTGEVDFENVAGVAEDATIELANSEAARKLKTEVWAAVDQLSEAQRTAVVLFYQEGQSCQEIGDIMGIPAVTVKSHLHRAREKLRDVLEPSVAEEYKTIQFPGAAAG